MLGLSPGSFLEKQGHIFIVLCAGPHGEKLISADGHVFAGENGLKITQDLGPIKNLVVCMVSLGEGVNTAPIGKH